MNRHNRLKILQYKLRRSRDMVIVLLLRDPQIDDFDIIAMHELWTNLHSATTHYLAKDNFCLCYPTGDAEGPPRVSFFIYKSID